MGLAEKFSPSAQGKSRAGCGIMIARIAVRSLQFILAVVVAGLYGVRVNAERAAHDPVSVQWVYAEVVAGLAAITAIVYSLPFVPSYKAFAWDAVLFILWTAVFGTFAMIYLHREDDDSYQGTDTERMRHAMWVDLCNMVLWAITALYGGLRFLKERKAGTKDVSASSVV